MSLVISTTRYVTDTARVSGGVYVEDEIVYIDKDTLMLINDSAEQVTNIGAVGEIVEAPDLTNSNDRMVIRLTVVEEYESPLKDLLRSRDL